MMPFPADPTGGEANRRADRDGHQRHAGEKAGSGGFRDGRHGDIVEVSPSARIISRKYQLLVVRRGGERNGITLDAATGTDGGQNCAPQRVGLGLRLGQQRAIKMPR